MKKILLSLIIFPQFALANTTQEFDPIKAGLPVANGGIQVKPLLQISKGLAAGTKSKVLIAHEQIKKKGFYEIENKDVKVILNMRYEKVLPPGSNNPHDSHLKSTISDVGLAFAFQGIPGIDPSNIIGYGAIGNYDNGWTGVTEVFTDSELGTCQYDLYNIKLSHGSEFIPQELVSYEVNHKPTLIDVRGNIHSGYMYKIHWADNMAIHDLYCANMTFNKSKTKKLVTLAKRIDMSVIIE